MVEGGEVVVAELKIFSFVRVQGTSGGERSSGRRTSGGDRTSDAWALFGHGKNGTWARSVM